MKSPASLGLPAKFDRWRKNQLDAVMDIAASDRRYIGVNAPTGFGKSVMYMSLMKLVGEGRSVVLTSTKSLQDQLAREFPYVVDIRGQVNYKCDLEGQANITADAAMCHFGFPCHLKGGGCGYFDTYRTAIKADVVVTNYAYWFSVHEYSEGLGGFDTLICDEAHNALDELGNFMSTRISDREIDAFLHRVRPRDDTKSAWHDWATLQLNGGDKFMGMRERLANEVKELMRMKGNRSMLRRVHEMRRVVKKLEEVQSIAASPNRWVFEGDTSLSWTPVWPGRGSYHLFRNVKRVVLVSATLTPKTLELLGIGSDCEFIQYPSTFPVAGRPVIHVHSGVALKHDTDSVGMRAWVALIDQIIRFRLDRKGIIHGVSYDRCRYILQNSKYSHLMVTHDRKGARGAIERFRSSPAPTILVSPSMDTGVDFPFEDAEYQIIAKVPFPDSRSPVMSSRSKDDPEFSFYTAMTTLVQMAGRGNRAASDRCQTFIVDDNIMWFMRRYRKFAPKWFLDAFHTVQFVPPPLPKLKRGRDYV